MSSIEIEHPHTQSPEQARQSVDEVAHKLRERFEVECDWDGDTLRFSRSGIDGSIELLPQMLRVNAKLGFMLSMMKAPIEHEIRRVLGERFI
ncbi:polyhydroxyalkanoic acid synthase [Pseudoxanthomonas kalamensis DSM 18571]|uniref:polyhydroxyalkanoic acid system family protein n=1 Tax=Pseudoxanthomonas kalamensis TaxID=289483 RepID=UPI001391763E|nr:polyhydroxyalkanoic acid system family protein [Pseudoxanthomonas kalamensis]KAF1707933.1 polyhydroxyalkanoic acid synthase [Pseudoxanthomonas kalamensis DSM 18571]